ncbi:hypothetical protein [Methylorubrum extorquens]
MSVAASSISISASKKSRRAASSRRPPPHLARDLAVVPSNRVVPCPYNPNERIAVTVNRHVDVLARERSNGRLTEAEFFVGRLCQEAWEKQSGARMGRRGFDPSGSRDQTVAHELSIIYALDDAAKVAAFNNRVAAAIGWTGVAVLKRFLVEGHTFSTYAGLGATEAQINKVGYRFRDRLKDLTEALYTATGAERQQIRSTRDD